MRRILLVLLALLTVPLGAQTPAPLQVPYQQFKLANGLNVILHRDTSIPVVAVNMWYYVGSANEKPGRTGFAHLFEHLMFEGSKHVPEGQFDILLEGAGGDNNGSTSNDRTNYVIDVPSNALELALFLESDRMGYLLDTMTPQRVDGQRDVVKNERRQSYENRPYGMASIEIDKMLWPATHPYSWPTIGYMEDLTAASHSDVVEFFKKYYAPNNASLVVAGDIDFDRTRALVEKWFGEIPRGTAVEPVAPPAAILTGVQKKTLTDKVTLPRLLPGVADAAVLRSRRRGARRHVVCARGRQELASLQAARLRHADCAGRVCVSAVGRTGQSIPDRRHRSHRPYGRGAAESDRRRARSSAPRRTAASRGAARDQPDGGVVLSADGARGKLRRKSRSTERVRIRGRRT